MNSPSQRRPARPPQRRRGQPPSHRSPRRSLAGLWVACGFFYAIAGLLLTSLAGPWVWAVAAAGALVQGLVLAGPESLRGLRWLRANLLVLGNIVGSTALAVALAIALNHLGTDNIDDIALGRGVLEVMLYSLLAALLAGLCSVLASALGNGLLRRQPRPRARLLLVLTGWVGLALGGAFGLLTTPATQAML